MQSEKSFVTNNVLKLIAAFFMVVDHIAFYFLNSGSAAYMVMRIFGRISFPLFAFCLAVGWEKTSSKEAYFTRLMVVAVITQLITTFFGYINILVTFCLAIGCIEFLNLSKKNGIPLYLSLTFLIPVCLFAEYIGADYGAYGILLTVGLWAIVNRKAALGKLANYPVLTAFLLLLVLNFFYALKSYLSGSSPFLAWKQMASLLALIPLYFYNGKRGSKKMRWWFYVFYPGHLLIILIILAAT